jgi:hypothetical protein
MEQRAKGDTISLSEHRNNYLKRIIITVIKIIKILKLLSEPVNYEWHLLPPYAYNCITVK